MTSLFLEPLDVLYLRGNRLFEGAGAYGEAQMPPWPSLVAGAIRSRMLTDAKVDLAAIGPDSRVPDPAMDGALGSPRHPGSFRVAAFTLGKRSSASIEPLFPAPADLHVTGVDDPGEMTATYMLPREVGLPSSGVLPKLPVVRANDPAKPKSGLWLTASGWRAYLRGDSVRSASLVDASELWDIDHRLGIALDSKRRRAKDGMLYTVDTVSFRRGVGFLVRIDGADGVLPTSGLVRLGGDGRGAAISQASIAWEAPDWSRILRQRRFKITLTSPGMFPGGWRPPGSDDSGHWSGPDGAHARLVSAVVHRAGVVSGWDLALRRPKPATRVASTGTVYWFEDFEGDAGALRKVADQGFWACMEQNEIDKTRRAEGFNHVAVANWPKEDDEETAAG